MLRISYFSTAFLLAFSFVAAPLSQAAVLLVDSNIERGVGVLDSEQGVSFDVGAFFDAGQARAEVFDNLSETIEKIKDKFIQDEIIVKFKGAENFRTVKVPYGKVLTNVNAFASRADVEYAEPNYIAEAYWTPNDTYFQLQWHMDNSQYGGVEAEDAWEILGAPGEPGGGAVVAIVDTGIAYENYSEGRGWRTSRYYRAPDFGNTCFVSGYDFVGNDSHPNDDNSHGTHVAGTVAQSTNNGEGVAGLAFDTCLMPVKVLDRNGSGTYGQVANGIRFAADNGADVINLSLGGAYPSQTIEDAVAYAYNKGVTILAAAGNDGQGFVGYPAAYDDYVIAVGATSFDETRAPYSNYGASLDLVAPGGNLNEDLNGDGYSDGVLQQTFNPNNKNTKDFGYWFFQGTSMATPHVAAAAALVIARGNATTPNEVRAALEQTADDIGQAGWDEEYGFGIVNAAAALGWSAGPSAPLANAGMDKSVADSDGSGFESVELDGTGSRDMDGTIISYEWSEGGILLAIGATSTLDFALGAHTITLTVTDNDGMSASDDVVITVNANQSPTADISVPLSAYVDEMIDFSAYDSDDSDGMIVSFEWDFGDGASASGEDVNHSYSSTGVYTVVLTVTDNGGASASDTATILVEEPSAVPTIHIGDITMSYDARGSRCRASAVVPVLDESEAGVRNVDVFVSWSGAYTSSSDASSDINGNTIFRTSWVRDCGTFTITVDDAAHNDYLYDSFKNIDTSESIVTTAGWRWQR